MSIHHRILGVSLEASQIEIKKAYYKKVRKVHPDVNPSPNATEEFIRVNNAYEILTNPNYNIPYQNKTSKPQTQTTKRAEQKEWIRKRNEAIRKESARKAKMQFKDLCKDLKKELFQRDIKKAMYSFLGLILIPVFFIFIANSIFEKNNSELDYITIVLAMLFFSSLFHIPIMIGIIYFYKIDNKT